MYQGVFIKIGLAALNGQKAVAWVFVNSKTSWQVTTLWALVLREVVDGLLLATAKRNFFTVQKIGNTLRVRVLVSHNVYLPL